YAASMRWQLVYLLRDFVVAPHTFLRPRVVDTSAPPELGAKAPELAALQPGRPSVVAFLRHVGCPFAEATVRQMVEQSRERPDIDLIGGTQRGDKLSQSWCNALGGAGGVKLVSDPGRARYAAWGVGLSDRRHFAGPDSLAALRRLLDEGIHNRWASGNRWQAA